MPIIIINPLPGQEEENANFLVDNYAAIWLKENDNIEDVISNTLDFPNTLEMMKLKSKQLGKPNSTKDICEILLGV